MSLPEVPGAKETVDALKGTPMLLVLLIVIVAAMAMIGFLAFKRAEQMSHEKSEVVSLLKECIAERKQQSNAVFSVPQRFWYLNK